MHNQTRRSFVRNVTLGGFALSFTEKLSSLLELKYGGIHDAVRELGDASEIGKLFAGFQKYLYEKQKSA